MSGYGNQEFNAIDMHDIKAKGDFLVSIKYALGYICYYDRFHMLDLVEDFFALKI